MIMDPALMKHEIDIRQERLASTINQKGQNDFIIVAEFCQIVGPVAREILHPYGKIEELEDGFDISQFVVKIMSVDIQTNNEDWFTCIELDDPKVYGFIHHIYLLDLDARGFVRPVVVSYLTKEKQKFQKYFNLFYTSFQKASDILKQSNSLLYKLDSKKKLADIIETRNSLIRDSEEYLQKYEMLNEYEKYLKEKHLELTLSELSIENDSNGIYILEGVDGKIIEYKAKIMTTIQASPSPQKKLREVNSVCPGTWKKCTSQLENILNRLHVSNINIYKEQYHQPKYMSSSILSTGYRNINFDYQRIIKMDNPYALYYGSTSSGSDFSAKEEILLEEASIEHSSDSQNTIPNINDLEEYNNPSYEEVVPGSGILEFRDYYPFNRHVIYSILKGRPTIISGEEERVIHIINAISIFVSGNNNILPWHTEQINMAMFATFKLIGIPNSTPIPLCIKPYVTILDTKNGAFSGPEYIKGVFVNDIMSIRQDWPNENTYLSYVESLLYDFGVKASLYYHRCCLGFMHEHHNNTPPALTNIHRFNKEHPKSMKNLDEISPQPKLRERSRSFTKGPTNSFAESEPTKFFRHHNISDHDAEIITYWAEVVKTQQSNEINGARVPYIKLDYTPIKELPIQKRKKL
eukprot:TRINITY_DN5768_c0_g1_i2.p1 TRINITY_DN5768_c0_g1~~TRINITY_DN5768_c0_g1_i2.p1  ORF type:complete len:636 (-),score=116.90 TRINITY_DN5768_c0_g1_i2:70-1977(-)